MSTAQFYLQYNCFVKNNFKVESELLSICFCWTDVSLLKLLSHTVAVMDATMVTDQIHLKSMTSIYTNIFRHLHATYTFLYRESKEKKLRSCC